MLIAVSTVALTFGNDRPDMIVVSSRGSEVFKVIYKGITSGRVKLSIFDGQGKIVLSENLQGKDGFIRPLNFKGLPSGNYTIQLVDDQGSYQESVRYVPSAELKSIHATKLDDEGRFLLSIANAQTEEIVIRIYDKEQRLLHSETNTLTGDFARVYKLDNMLKQYVCEVSDGAGNKKLFSF